MIFVDESIHDQLDFICVGMVYTPWEVDTDVERALRDAGMRPYFDEYKSGRRTENQPNLHTLRDAIGDIALNCRLAIYIASTSERARILSSIVEVAQSIIQANILPVPQNLFVDEGMIGKHQAAPEQLIVHAGCNSKRTLGIQLADYVAYHCGYLLKCALTETSKPVQINETPHPLAGESVDFDWLTRTKMRRSFLHEPRDFNSITGDDWFVNISGYGAFYSQHLSPRVRDVARATFDEMYLGCVW
ncbi:hypothetical protein [Alcaligenes phenolicus]|uniref:hypothetical protein n=1 Tax=Alcaligenes phenolicus TaxID=232846 RepID=UPI002AA6E832|nr:hypothetical protein [Alcaligenes phenolicus]